MSNMISPMGFTNHVYYGTRSYRLPNVDRTVYDLDQIVNCFHENDIMVKWLFWYKGYVKENQMFLTDFVCAFVVQCTHLENSTIFKGSDL